MASAPPASGKGFDVLLSAISRCQDDKITELKVMVDMFVNLRQIGVA